MIDLTLGDHMKKILLASLILSLGTLDVQAASQASGCLTLQNTNWQGTVTYDNNSTVPVAVHITSMQPNQIGYAMNGTVDIDKVKGIPFAANQAVCTPGFSDPTTIQGIIIIAKADQNVVNLSSMGYNDSKNPTTISSIFGKFNQNMINYGTIKKQ